MRVFLFLCFFFLNVNSQRESKLHQKIWKSTKFQRRGELKNGFFVFNFMELIQAYFLVYFNRFASNGYILPFRLSRYQNSFERTGHFETLDLCITGKMSFLGFVGGNIGWTVNLILTQVLFWVYGFPVWRDYG